jgi:hypothetical protein
MIQSHTMRMHGSFLTLWYQPSRTPFISTKKRALRCPFFVALTIPRDYDRIHKIINVSEVAKRGLTMKQILLPLCFVLLLSCLALAKNEEMMSLYKQLKIHEIDPTRIARLSNVILQRDAATFHFDQGTIYFFQPAPLKGKKTVTGAIFIGSGSFHFVPPTQIEKEQLARFHADAEEELNTAFDMVLLRFADTTFAEVSQNVNFEKIGAPANITDEIAHCENYMYEERNGDIICRILLSLLRNPESGYFHAHVHIPGHDPVFFTYDPHTDEEVSLEKCFSKLNYEKELVNSFHKKGDEQRTSDLDRGATFFAEPSNYRINATIESNGDFSATCDVTVAVNADSVIMLLFGLSRKLSVDSVTTDKGTHLSFIKDKETHGLIVFLDSPLRKGEERTIKVSYRGDILEKLYGDFYIKSSTLWYPRLGRNRSPYELTFKTPKQYDFITIGKKIEDATEDGYRISRWKQTAPVITASFNLGPFKVYEMDIPNAPPITVYMSELAHREIAHHLIEHYGIASGKNMEKQVGADVANSIQLFEHLFGKFPGEALNVTEIPFGHAEAFPGLLHLPWSTFQLTDDWGEDEILRAHEVAHQWWGVTVGCETYHDMWLAEGFAQYSGLWYMQWIKKDTKRFFKILDEWKNDILSNRKYVLGSGVEAGPIWLGPRTSSTLTEGDYFLIVYKKGAYVLHMLRNMLIDLKTMNEDAFIAMLEDYYETYKYKDASTDDFKQIVEKHIGQDMDWFFEQWIYGTAIPTYLISYRAFEQPDGKYLIKLRVKQEEVPEGFKMYVPITIKFKGDQLARLRFTIDKPYEEFSIPSPLKPEEIIFNDFHSVLAEVKYEKFTD